VAILGNLVQLEEVGQDSFTRAARGLAPGFLIALVRCLGPRNMNQGKHFGVAVIGGMKPDEIVCLRVAVMAFLFGRLLRIRALLVQAYKMIPGRANGSSNIGIERVAT